jgi:hypothetical protein
MDTEHDPDRATPPAEEEAQQLDPWERMRRAAQELTQAAHELPPAPPVIGLPAFQLPRMPRLQLTYEEDEPPTPVDQRHLNVAVRVVPVSCGTMAATHNYSDPDGLTWHTYGNERDFSTLRMLEVQNANGDVVASYPAGTWLDVCYPAYHSPSQLKDLS